MIENIVANADKYLVILFAVLGLGSAIARVTPNDSDNRVMAIIWKWGNRLGLRGGATD